MGTRRVYNESEVNYLFCGRFSFRHIIRTMLKREYGQNQLNRVKRQFFCSYDTLQNFYTRYNLL